MLLNAQYGLKAICGSLLLDLPGTLARLLLPGRWVGVRNRHDRLEHAPTGPGVALPDKWSSDLHVCKVFPFVGRLLMTRALAEWPIRLRAQPRPSLRPQVSFVLPFRGLDRLPLLLAVIQSIQAQEDADVECVVVEQSAESVAAGRLPAGVQHLHLPHPSEPESWRKSWAFNAGVRAATADIVVCHDADIVVPCHYAREIRSILGGSEYEVAHLQRFLFCLTNADTSQLVSANALTDRFCPERVRQNWQGGTLAIQKEGFAKIGGYDEDFVSWGGEDNEFYDRCRTLKAWRWGRLPFVHLWHAPQAQKSRSVPSGQEDFLAQKLATPPAERIRRLVSPPA